MEPRREAVRERRWRPGLALRWALVLVGLAGVGLVSAAEYVLHHAEPFVRRRIVETLSARFGAPVALDRLEISLFRGIEVNGYGLRLGTPSTAIVAAAAVQPTMISVQHFAFRTTMGGLLRQPTHVAAVRVEGMDVYVPPPGERRSGLFGPAMRERGVRGGPKIAVVVEELRCRGVRLFLASGRPGKVPLRFDIATLDLEDVGGAQGMRYHAVLTNARPAGQIRATGHFGPWADGEPGGEASATPLDGVYSFDHANLNTIKGIGGTLSSTGRFAGVLGRITIDGETDVPDFSLDISHRPVPLHTDFHAVVDGTSGDTYLQPVHGRLLSSEFTTCGKVVKVKGRGHDIELQVDVPHGRVEDFLRLAVKTDPPLMNGTLSLKGSLRLPPGDERVPLKLAMNGTVQMEGVRFNNPRLQERIDGLSARAQGRPQAVAEVRGSRETEVRSALAARFAIGHGVAEVSEVRYAIPGALVLLKGVYSMDGKLFEFKGRVQTKATASAMVGGWKGMLLSPLDRLLEKPGAGVDLPIEISGTGAEVHIGLAVNGSDETPQAMLSDAREQEHGRRELRRAQQEAEEASEDDRAAARATTLEEAEAAHARAVRRRAEAQRRAETVRPPL